MGTYGFHRTRRPLEILSAEQVETFHRATLRVLETTGVRFESTEALELFERSGCRVDRANSRVRFPTDIIDASLRSVPSSFTLAGRDPERTLRLGEDRFYFYNSVGLETIDIDTFDPVMPTLQDQHDGVRVLDALDHMHLLGSYTPYMNVEGIAPSMLLLESLASRIRHTTKPTLAGYAQGSERFAVQLAQAAGIQLGGWVMATPPLTFFGDACGAAFRWAGAGFPVFITSGGSYGVSAPATVAGSTVVNNAELLAAIVLVQLIRPGTAIMVADFTFPTNMRTARPIFGSTVSMLHATIFAQTWRSLGIPTACSTSGYSNAKKLDYESGYNKALSAFSAALSGMDVVSLHGGVAEELTFHPAQAILDDDIAASIGRLLEGVEISEETIALELIESVGPLPNTYLDARHTRDWWRKEQDALRVGDRLDYKGWREAGKKSALELARERCEAVLASHQPTTVPDDQDREMTGILAEAERHYRATGLM